MPTKRGLQPTIPIGVTAYPYSAPLLGISGVNVYPIARRNSESLWHDLCRRSLVWDRPISLTPTAFMVVSRKTPGQGGYDGVETLIERERV